MLSPREEQILREQIRDNTPMRVVGGPTSTAQPGDREFGRQINEQLEKLPKMKPVNLNENPELEYKLRKVMKKGEKLGEFFSRTGLGLAQIMSMSDSEIRSFVAIAEENNRESGFVVPARGSAEAASTSRLRTVVDTFMGVVRGE